ncbi:PP2C family protein-serine/threonine phosphatase [Nocardia sp. NPDC051321]|uniref:PP2C family protein-serine/threonine phosphatase n=1 Tax=Nocardia sp. NPDC051321 TaxID=3364323 RepID=UPI0037972336
MNDEPSRAGGERVAVRARDQQRSLEAAFAGSELTVEQLWMRYFGLGGGAGHLEIDAYLHGLGQLPDCERDVLAHAVNERLDELAWSKRALYSRVLGDPRARNAPLSALLALLEGAQLAPPQRLHTILTTAGDALGVRITAYLIDYDQRFLHPVPPSDLPHQHPGSQRAPSERPGIEQADIESAGIGQGRIEDGGIEQDSIEAGRSFDVDTTLPGRAYRLVQQLPSHHPDHPRLWVPLLDGSERLGVLDVQVQDPADLHDPALAAQCRWLSHLAGHLITVMNDYGDFFDRIRLRTPRTPNAELIWSLLPPLTAGVDNFTVAGVLEPRHDLNGDAFDYALSEHTAQLLVLDAVGHEPRSGLIAATALAAYRSARHRGHGLYEQARTIDETLTAEFGNATFATAVLAELDLHTGRLRYINAGHPEPLIMRAGKIVKPLNAGHRLPLGLGTGELVIAEETLQPEDWLILYTDGVTEARDDAGEFFGTDRLIDLLRREAAAGHPPPETSRRLINAILTHQHNNLQDDATVLLARWTHPQPHSLC